MAHTVQGARSNPVRELRKYAAVMRWLGDVAEYAADRLADLLRQRGGGGGGGGDDLDDLAGPPLRNAAAVPGCYCSGCRPN